MIDPKDYPRRLIGERRLAPADAVDRLVVAVNLAESPLGWLARRGMVSAVQFAAGERLRADHARAGLGARVTMRWDAVPTGRNERQGSADAQTLGSLSARRRFEAAMAAVGPGLSDVLWRVVCEGEGLTDAERGLGWPARAGKLVLGLALDRLVAHYKTN
jgi:hypothetical protein